jgi:aerobic carbon-monoxide dehydrogenase small subunit
MPRPHAVRLVVNGEVHDLEVEPGLLLAGALRDRLGLDGAQVGCVTSGCGACTVHLDGHAVKSCAVLAVQADGSEVTTIEGLGGAGGPHPLLAALAAGEARGCGFCTAGMVMAATALLDRDPHPAEDDVLRVLEGNACPCPGRHDVVRAVLRVAEERGPGTELEEPTPEAREAARQFAEGPGG